MTPLRLLVAALVLAWTTGAPLTAQEPEGEKKRSVEESTGFQIEIVNSVWRGVDEVGLDGRRWNAGTLEGRVVLLDFWATWCAPCLEELPTLQKAWRRYRDRDFVLLGVSVDRTTRRTLESWLRRHDVAWPQIHDNRELSGALARRFGVDAVPRSLLVDRQGRVVAVDLRGEVLLTVLRDVLGDVQGDALGDDPGGDGSD